jgi:hypothetical protein
MPEALALDFPTLAEIEAELRSLPPIGVNIHAAMRYAPWPIWRGSKKTPTKWVPIQKADAAKWLRMAEEWPRLDELPGRGHLALLVLNKLLFKFLNWKTGRLDPSYEGIARACRRSRSAVAEALKQLRRLGLLAWCRRCHEITGKDGRFSLAQETNAYFVLPPSHWTGFQPKQQEEPPAPETWGATPPLPAGLEAAAQATGIKEQIDALELVNDDPLARALARLGRSIHRRPPD